MQHSLWFRRVTLLTAAVGALAAAIGACGGDFANGNNFDGSGPQDGGGGASDMGFLPGDGGGDSVTLESPLPFSSNLPTTTTFQFRCNLATDTPQSLEPFVSIVSRADGTMLSGAWSWKQTSAGVYQLSLLPSGVAADTDYVVTVKNPAQNSSTKPILFRTGVSIGSHPQIVDAQLRSMNKAAQVLFLIRFSEPMDPASVASAVSVSMGGSTVAGTLTAATNMTGPANTWFEYDLPANPTIKTPIILQVKSTAQAATGHSLDPDSWDSATNVNGDWSWTVPVTMAQPLDMQTSAIYPFSPTIN